MRLPTSCACTAVNGAASRTGVRMSSQVSSGLLPSLTSLLCTSARLTVLIIELLNSSTVSFSAPGSLFSTASKAEASSTAMLLTLACLAAFGDQFVHQRPARLYISPDALPGPFEPAFQSCDP